MRLVQCPTSLFRSQIAICITGNEDIIRPRQLVWFKPADMAVSSTSTPDMYTLTCNFCPRIIFSSNGSKGYGMQSAHTSIRNRIQGSADCERRILLCDRNNNAVKLGVLKMRGPLYHHNATPSHPHTNFHITSVYPCINLCSYIIFSYSFPPFICSHRFCTIQTLICRLWYHL